MSDILKPDICVIGGGSGGLSVAAAAAAFGVSVVLIEKGAMGGDCLNTGCVPSKALIAAAKQAHSMREASKFGIADVEPQINFRQVHDHVHGVIAAIAPMDSVERFTALGVEVIKATAEFADAKTVVAGDRRIQARRFVVATGSAPFVPPIPGLDSVPYLTNETIFSETRKPAHLVVIGGGPIGMELAQAHRRLGCAVTVIEGLKALGKDDPEMTAIALSRIRAEGVVIHEGARVAAVEKRGKTGIRVIMQHGDQTTRIDGSHLLVATGRAATVEGLGLDKAGIKYDRKGITVSDKMRTSNRRVYAIGDVAGSLQFTHMAGYHAGLVIRSILFRMRAREQTHLIPRATYTDPEIAHVGHTEQSARDAFKTIRILRWPYTENDRAQAEHKTSGLIKIIARPNGKIEGVSIVGHNAGELISYWVLALGKQLTVKDIAGTVAPYPTYAEIGKRAATSFYAPATGNPWIRRLIAFLRIFG